MASSSDSSWFDGIYKTCEHSGTGSVPGVVYKANGDPIYDNLHHKAFRLVDNRSGKEVKLYGIVDGFQGGSDIAQFVAQRLINEILPLEHTGSHVMNNNPTDAQIIALLHESFQKVDRAYFSDHIGEVLARRCALQIDPSADESIHKYDTHIKALATAVVALVYENRLFVANLGDGRAIVVRHVDGETSAIQMSKWHHPSDTEERKRLANINAHHISAPTRCFGDFFRKGGYKENPEVNTALCEPVIAEPSVHGSLPVDSSLRFLILINGGVVQTIAEESPNENVNVKVATLLSKEFVQQRSMPVVARAVLDCLAREHQDALSHKLEPPELRQRRELVLTFCYLGDFTLRSSILNSTLIDDGDTIDEVPSGHIPLDDEGRVAPYVDLSCFETHPRKDDVLRQISDIIRNHGHSTPPHDTDEQPLRV